MRKETRLYGDLARPGTLTVPELAGGRAQRAARVVFQCRTSGPRRHLVEGPPLWDVLSAAGPAFDPERHKDRLRFLISVTGADGHRTVLSWGEMTRSSATRPPCSRPGWTATRWTTADPSSSCRATCAARGT